MTQLKIIPKLIFALSSSGLLFVVYMYVTADLCGYNVALTVCDKLPVRFIS